MRVDGQPRLNAAKNLSRLFGRSVMPYDPPNCVRPPHLVRSRLRHFVNQYVGAFRVSNKILAWSRVARDDHRMASVINSVAERWLDPITMINFECRYLYPALFVHDTFANVFSHNGNALLRVVFVCDPS